TAISRCSFDQSYCSWVSDNTTAAEWQLRGAFATLDQGPTRDHTTGSSNGQFLYLPGRIRPVPARIIGPMLQPAEGCQIRLYYDIRGQGPLSLQIKVRTELNGEERAVWTREDPTEGYYLFTQEYYHSLEHSTAPEGIRLYYDIRGQGPLSLQIKVRTELNGEERAVWTREDPTEGYYFAEDRFTFNETQSFQVIVEGSIIISKGKTNYIALDDISFNHKCVPQITPLPTLPPEVTTLPPTKVCKYGEFSCTHKQQCIPMSQKCDFREDCTDGSDEHHCGKCDFHEDMCGLINLAAWSSYKWQRMQAESFSLKQGTSLPDTDSQKNKQGYFAVLTGKTYYTYTSRTIMRTPVLGATSHACRLEFYYHFNVKGGGLLEMYVSQIGYGAKIRRFSQTANTGKEWQFASISIGNYPAGKVFEFHGNADYQKVGSEVQDIAIDNINYVNCDPNLIYSESLNCTFDYDDCGWHPDNNFTVATWSRAKSSPQNYGPKSDHTGRKGYFMYVSGNNYMTKGNKAHLVSLKQNATEKRCMNFWYHMYGEDVGTMNLIIRTDTDNTTIWTRTGSQGNSWKQGMRTIRSQDPYVIVIEAIIGSFVRPVIALDDIEIYEDECPHPVACNFEADFCEWTSTGWILQLGKGSIPSKDHTTDTETGRYAALNEETGTLTSPDYNYTKNEYCLNFWYFLEGDRNTGLKVQRVEQTAPDMATVVWADVAEPNHRGQWMHSRASIENLLSGDYNIVILGNKANASTAVAVDDVAIEDGACPPYGSCNFERDFCTWRNMKPPISSGLQWIRNSGSIVSSNTGPKIDHTTGSAAGWYIYMDGNYGRQGQTAVLESENLHYSPQACFKYWYHMYGWGSGSLQVSYVNHSDSRIYDVMKISGSQGNNWYPVKRLVKGLPPTYRIRFIGVKGWGGDLALDDILIQDGTCDEPQITTPPPTETPPTDWDCDFEAGDFCTWLNGDGWRSRMDEKLWCLRKDPR
ncbi:hypothetical protein CDAR_255532, partial [Caerostris darwini]